jgi:hypothetical protein
MMLFLPAAAYAEGGSCNFPTVIVPDGRIIESTIPDGTNFWYLFDTTPGRSFSIEFKDPLEAWGNFPGALAVFQTGTCSTVITPRDTVDVAPSIPNTARRVSITTTAFRQWFTLANSSGGTRPYTVSVSETTLYSPLWSTFGGFETFYRFQNTTNASCEVNLRLVNDAGTQVAGSTFSIPANRTAPTRNTGPGDLNIADSQAGQAIITHDCPPGAIQVDGFLGNFGVFPPVVLPIKIVAAREATH